MATKEDILNAAIKVFAEQGYRGGTVRDICELASANIAAVNYHFGDKASLYAEVLQHAYRSTAAGEPMPLLSDSQDEPANQLQAWIQWYLMRLMRAGDSDVGRLMAREMADPTPALDALATRAVQPVFSELERLVNASAGGTLSARRTRLFATSVVGQCLIYRTGAAMLERLEPPHFDKSDASDIARHIFDLTIASLRRITGEVGA